MGTRDRILDAAAEVVLQLGLARATTKEIARASGFSEATLYKHFRDKNELVLAVLHERLPPFIPLLAGLADRVGTGTVTGTLEEVAASAVAFYEVGTPMMGSLFAEQALLARHRDEIQAAGAGPHLANRALAHYLRGEQKAGRIAADADPDAAAVLLLGACLQRAFFRHLVGERASTGSAERFAQQIVRALVGRLLPA